MKTIEADLKAAQSGTQFIPLSVPEIRGNEWQYVKECLDTGWVSSVGSYVERFETDGRCAGRHEVCRRDCEWHFRASHLSSGCGRSTG